MKIPIIAIVGPTAVGKTELSIKIAKKYNCEIISIDSVQIYKKFDIGSAKISKEEMSGIKHHFIDYLDPKDKFSVFEFQKLVRNKIKDIYFRGKIPLLIGGSGYYMSAILYDYKFANYDKFNKEDDISIYKMLEYLKENYLETYEKIDKNNHRRIINAYNYVLNKKENTTENRGSCRIYNQFNPYVIVLNMDRKKLYERINLRVEKMFEMGLIEEVQEIINNYGYKIQPMNSIGYKELISYILSENVDIETIKGLISKNTRNYAKRQITWYKNKMFNTNWYDVANNLNIETIFNDIRCFLEGK